MHWIHSQTGPAGASDEFANNNFMEKFPRLGQISECSALTDVVGRVTPCAPLTANQRTPVPEDQIRLLDTVTLRQIHHGAHGVTRPTFARTSGLSNKLFRCALLHSRLPLLTLFFLLVGLMFALSARAQTDSTNSSFAPILIEQPTNESPAMARMRTALHGKIDELDRKEGKPPTWKIHIIPVSTNGAQFTVKGYSLRGNSTLSPGDIADVLTNVPAAFGTNVTLDGIRAALGDLQMAYRERGFATVSVSLPQQKLTNGVVKVQVTEGRIASINVVSNRWYSSNNVMRTLPSLHTNMLLNSHVFQRELDTANASRDRQIYPKIEPGEEPGTTELTLRVVDQFPLHGRIEVNNQATPNTPDIRVNSTLQYDNLWNLDHQIGLQYSFDWQNFRNNNIFSATPLDQPEIASYSGYYRMPLGGYTSVREQIEANPSKFGYDVVTHQFNLPPATSRPELTIFASRSISDPGVVAGHKSLLTQTTATNSSGTVFHPLSITEYPVSDNISLNEDLGGRFSVPLPQWGKLSTTLTFGADYKHYRLAAFNTNQNLFQVEYYDQQGVLHVNDSLVPQALAPEFQVLNYLPVNIGLNGSYPDAHGTTYFNVQGNVNVPVLSGDRAFMIATTNFAASAEYATVQAGMDRLQTIHGNWTLKLHADGQWANGPLFNNEKFAMGGVSGVRGYSDGEQYGDEGWRVSIEPQTPLKQIAAVGTDNTPLWVRSSVFLDYGHIYLLDPYYALLKVQGGHVQQTFCGVGWSLTGNIGSHLDARLTVGVPLITDEFLPHGTRAGDVHIYFGIGAQF